MKILLFCIFSIVLFAERVEITSSQMKAENLKKEVHFIGDAKVKKGADWLHAQQVIVYFDDHNTTHMYEALGEVTFLLHHQTNSYQGKAEKVRYYPLKLEYEFEGKVVIDDLGSKRHVKGDVIYLNMKTGNIDVKGSSKHPVKFIFDTKEKE